jgi:hypothetical protein
VGMAPTCWSADRAEAWLADAMADALLGPAP